jgi:hypothetical protein
LLRMMPTRTLIAVRVWLRASERISVSALAICHVLNNLCAHENPSHTAIATRPANASEIRYTVMQATPCHSRPCEEQSDEATATTGIVDCFADRTRIRAIRWPAMVI